MLRTIQFVVIAIVLFGMSPVTKASVVDGSIFFDHFPGTALDSGKWPAGDGFNGGGTVTVDSSLLTVATVLNTAYMVRSSSATPLIFPVPTDWAAEALFRMTGTLQSNDGASGQLNAHSEIILAGNLSGDFRSRGFDLRAVQSGATNSDVFDLGWYGFDNSGTRAPLILATGLNKDQFYTVSAHRKSDNTVDIYLNDGLIGTQPLIVANPAHLQLGDYSPSSRIAATLALDYVSVGNFVPPIIPEPSSMSLMTMAVLGLMGYARRNRK